MAQKTPPLRGEKPQKQGAKLDASQPENPSDWDNDWDEEDLDWLLPYDPPDDAPQPDPGDFWFPDTPWPENVLPARGEPHRGLMSA